jgi:hypothetical protein
LPTNAPSLPILGRDISRADTAKFLLRAAVTMQTSVISKAPAGPWHISDNARLQDCISVPATDGDGDMQIGKAIAGRALRIMIAADPVNLTKITKLMELAVEVDLPDPALQILLDLAATWNHSMSLNLDEPWGDLTADDDEEPTATTTAPVEESDADTTQETGTNDTTAADTEGESTTSETSTTDAATTVSATHEATDTGIIAAVPDGGHATAVASLTREDADADRGRHHQPATKDTADADNTADGW